MHSPEFDCCEWYQWCHMCLGSMTFARTVFGWAMTSWRTPEYSSTVLEASSNVWITSESYPPSTMTSSNGWGGGMEQVPEISSSSLWHRLECWSSLSNSY
jgi:hypothetical protein